MYLASFQGYILIQDTRSDTETDTQHEILIHWRLSGTSTIQMHFVVLQFVAVRTKLQKQTLQEKKKNVSLCKNILFEVLFLSISIGLFVKKF